MSLRRFVKYLLPLLLWMLIIFGGSTDIGSTEHTSTFIERLFAALPGLQNLPHAFVAEFEHVVRKAAHITEYTILAMLAYRAIRQDRTKFRDIDAWGPILLCIVYASTDEYHQTFVATRGPSIGDVLFDTCGGIIGTVINLWRLARQNHKD